jgi:polysaccharide deacetylase family protein (PEP-CTERM system associated)
LNVPSVAFTVDVEDWYQVENLKHIIARESWNLQESRVQENTFKILDMLDETKSRGTFFVLGYTAERAVNLVKEISLRGHEIACHGFNHELIYRQSPKNFKEDVRASKELLEDITGTKVVGYRAPSFSITDWAIDILKECGFEYDSSLYEFSSHDRYGKLAKLPGKNSHNEILSYDNGLAEIPLFVLTIFGMKVPWAGGGYFRLIPYNLFKRGIDLALKNAEDVTFYIHPWEIDPLQPRVQGLRFSHCLRHYINLHGCPLKLSRFCTDYTLVSIADKLRLNLTI